MKTWEMIKELTENLEKKFISTQRNLTLTACATKSNQGIKFIDIRGDGVTNISLDREWEEVKEPVSFAKAIESGKRIRVEHESLQKFILRMVDPRFIDALQSNTDGEYEYPNHLINSIAYYSDKDTFRDIILNGKWYIE